MQNSKLLDEFNLDDILARAETTDTSIEEEVVNADGGAAFLEQWRVRDVGVQSLSWEEIIPETERQKEIEEENLKQLEEMYSSSIRRRAAVNSTPYTNDGDGGGKKKARKRTKAKPTEMKTGPFVEKEIRAIYRTLIKFGDPSIRKTEFFDDLEFANRSESSVIGIAEKMLDMSTDALLEYAASNPDIFPSDSFKDEDKRVRALNISLKMPPKAKMISFVLEKFTVNAGLLIQRVHDFAVLHSILSSVPKLTSYRISCKVKSVTNWGCTWTPKDDSMLLVGVYKHGFGNWEGMAEDDELPFQRKFFLEKHEKKLPKALHLLRRAEYLMKTVEEDAKNVALRSVGRKGSSATGGGSKRGSYSSSSRPLKKACDVEDLEKDDDDIVNDDGKKPKKRSSSVISNSRLPLKKKRILDAKKNESTDKPSREANDISDDSDYASMDEIACKEIFRPVKKSLKGLKTLKKDLVGPAKAKYLKDNLERVGDHIICLKEAGNCKISDRNLW